MLFYTRRKLMYLRALLLLLLLFLPAFVPAAAAAASGDRQAGRFCCISLPVPPLSSQQQQQSQSQSHSHRQHPSLPLVDQHSPYDLHTSRHSTTAILLLPSSLRGGGIRLIPAGYNPFGYKITALGLEFLAFDGSLDSDVGRFLASLKKKRITTATLKDSWLEIVRNAKTAQAMRIYRRLDVLIEFCLKAGFVD